MDWFFYKLHVHAMKRDSRIANRLLSMKITHIKFCNIYPLAQVLMLDPIAAIWQIL
jgi:hypothetical protein